MVLPGLSCEKGHHGAVTYAVVCLKMEESSGRAKLAKTTSVWGWRER